MEKKNYIFITKSGIKENADILRPNAIPKTRLSICHIFVRAHTKKKYKYNKNNASYLIFRNYLFKC